MSKHIGAMSLGTLAKPFFLSGVVATVFALPVYAWDKWEQLPVWVWMLLFLITPLFNGVISTLMLFLTYPVYRWLARRHMFRFQNIEVED